MRSLWRSPTSIVAQVLTPADERVLNGGSDVAGPAARSRPTQLKDIRSDVFDRSQWHPGLRKADREKSKGDWSHLTRLQPGQLISVDAAGKRRMTGRLTAVDDSGVTLETIYGSQRVERADVQKVTAAATRRMKVAGFVTAAGAGLVIAHLASVSSEEPLPSKFSILGLPTLIFGVALLGKEKPRTGEIYRRP